ncbi:nuclease-related domain-containing protein [Actinomadura rudentiformis]|uniref:NERD domain-containing protein n=1 Tax=Actinomadura rudentiformis TaxID=359158 RepID=A0A6H9Z0J8_9ACTN|nr:nuclease-related domain-containing protein [Actinomadura rudentiformis]KAB2347966.1 NERD domain-containing protein [Actinomadura rudentiformis]
MERVVTMLEILTRELASQPARPIHVPVREAISPAAGSDLREGAPSQVAHTREHPKYGSDARRGDLHEKRVAQAIEQWLNQRDDHFHLFHDLAEFHQVSGAGLEPLSLGGTNLDHVVLTGDTWLIVDAKGCGAGVLGLDPNRDGVLVKPDGTTKQEKWLDDGRAYSRAGVLYRLTDGIRGQTAWIVPDTTLLHPSLQHAACRKRGGLVLPMRALTDGHFDQHFPAPQRPADPAHIARLSTRLSTHQQPRPTSSP